MFWVRVMGIHDTTQVLLGVMETAMVEGKLAVLDQGFWDIQQLSGIVEVHREQEKRGVMESCYRARILSLNITNYGFPSRKLKCLITSSSLSY